MRPRFVGRLGAADVVTVANAVVGFLAAVAATVDPRLSARLILLAAMGDGLDGVVARHVGSTPVGKYLDSLSDVAAFGVAPAMMVAAVALGGSASPSGRITPRIAAAVGVPALFLGVVVVRLGFYTAHQSDEDVTVGVPSTLAATLLSATVLAGVIGATGVLVATAAFCYLMVARITYPDLLARDVLLMGAVQGLAVLFPVALGRAFPYALFALALSYLVLGPRFYWRPDPGRG